MVSWNSIYLEVAYSVLGWISFLSWSLCFYPQVLLNYRRKSVVGFNFDFPTLNLTKHTSYLIYNAAMFFSPEVQRQYYDKYGPDQMIPVGLNDVFFSIHALSLTAFTLFQIFIYQVAQLAMVLSPQWEVIGSKLSFCTRMICTIFFISLFCLWFAQRGNQKISKTCIAITAIIWASALFSVILAWPKHSWLWLITIFNTIQVIITLIKYIPQAVMNFKRKSTVGWSIGFTFFDFFGGLFSLGQMCAQSIDQGSTVNFYGNTGKLLLCLESILFDLLFIVQHYVLYPELRDKDKVVTTPGETEPFIGTSRMEGMKVSTSRDEDTGTGTNNLMIVAVAENQAKDEGCIGNED